MEEKHGLALFCVFILGWTLLKVATKPAPQEPVEFHPASRSAPPRQTSVVDPAPAAAPRPTEAGGAPGGPPAMMASNPAAASPAPRTPEAYGSAAGEPSPESAGASASPRLGAANGFQLSSEAGARASASVQTYGSGGAGTERAFAAGAARPGTGATRTAFAAGGPTAAPSAARRASAGNDVAARGVPPSASPGAPARGGSSADAAPALEGGGLPSFAKPAAPPRDNAAAAPGGDSGGGGGGGGGDSSGGGGSGGGGLSSSGINARPTSSAGKPSDAAAGGSAPGAGGSASSSASGGGSSGFSGGMGGSPSSSAAPQDSPQEPASVNPVVGAPALADPKKTDDLYANKHGGPRVIPVFMTKTETGHTAVTFTGKMSIDADGAGPSASRDRTGRHETALLVNGASLDPLRTPYAVKPTGFGHGVELGDYVAVTYARKTIITIVGDNGPHDEVGECSISCARSLGIPHDPNTGGVKDGVTYTFLAGSRDSPPPLNAAEIQKRGAAKFEAARLRIQ